MSTEKIEEQILEYYAKHPSNGYEKPEIEVRFLNDNTKCVISLSKMYSGIGAFATFKDLTWISNLLGTDEIDLENADYRPGCDTCDYGSSDSVDIVCRNVKLKDTENE